MDDRQTLNKKIRQNFYSHTKTEISKIILYFYQGKGIYKKLFISLPYDINLYFSFFMDWTGSIDKNKFNFFLYSPKTNSSILHKNI